MRSADTITDATSSGRPILTDEDMKALAQASLAEKKNAWIIAEELDPSQKDQFWAEYESAQKQQRRTRNVGEAFVKERFGEQSYPLFETALPKWGKMIKDIALLIPTIIEEGAGYAVDKGPLWPAHAYKDVIKFGSTFAVQLGKEMLASPTEEIKRLEALRDSTNDAEFQKGVQQNIDALWAEERPLWTLINDTFGDAYGYLDLRDPERFLEKLAYDSPQVVSDMAGIAAIVITRGAAIPAVGKLQIGIKGMKFAEFAKKAGKILDWVDPATSPFKAAQLGAKRAFGPTSPLMRSPMADETDRKMQDIARGLGVDDPTQQLPLSQQNPSEAILGREQVESMNPLRSGKAMERKDRGYDTGMAERDRIISDMNPEGVALDAESAGQRALESLDEEQFTRRAEARAEYAPLREHGDKRFSPEFELERKLQDLIDELKGSGEEVDPDAVKAAEIIESRLKYMRERSEAMGTGPNPINQMSIQSLRQLRTNFRTQYRNAFLAQDANKVTKIGEHSPEAQVYNRITKLFDEAIEDMQTRGGGLPADFAEGIKAGDQIWRDRARLEATPGGELLLKHKDKPGALIDTILNSNTVTTQQLENIYELLGEDAASNLKAALMENVFGRAKLVEDVGPAVKDGPNPGLLSKKWSEVTAGHPPEFMNTMFGAEAVERINQLAYFMDGLMPAFKMKTGSQTYRAVIGAAAGRMSAGGGLGWAMQQAVDLTAEIMGGAGVDARISHAVWMIGSMASAYGVDSIIYSRAARTRILDGIDLSPRQKQLLDAQMQNYTKSAETATRVGESAEKAMSKKDDEGADE